MGDAPETAKSKDGGPSSINCPMLNSTSEPELETESESEWERDSYDGREYITNPEDRARFQTDENYSMYCRRRRDAIATRGFKEDIWNRVISIQPNEPPQASLVSLCVEKHNRVNGKTVECVRIVRATRRGAIPTRCGGLASKFYITFMAREYPNGDLVEYQAKAKRYYKDFKPPIPIFCRPSM